MRIHELSLTLKFVKFILFMKDYRMQIYTVMKFKANRNFFAFCLHKFCDVGLLKATTLLTEENFTY